MVNLLSQFLANYYNAHRKKGAPLVKVGDVLEPYKHVWETDAQKDADTIKRALGLK